MNFEDLQESWQAQSVKPITDLHKLSEQKSRWQIRQRKILRANICMSLGFLAAMTGLAWIYTSFHHEFGWPFKTSIGTMYILMFIFSAIAWKSYAFKKEKLEVSSDNYLNYQIRKLNWQRNMITKYTWVYIILLWLALVMYIWEITTKGTTLLRFTDLAFTTIYLFGITWWNRMNKQRRQLIEINSLIIDLENMKNKLLENENNS